MRIAIDISPIIYGTGVSVYTKNLIENLLKVDSENEYILFGGSLRRRQEFYNIFNKYFSNNKKVVSKFFPIAPTISDFMWNRVHMLKVEKLIGRIDVFHSS